MFFETFVRGRWSGFCNFPYLVLFYIKKTSPPKEFATLWMKEATPLGAFYFMFLLTFYCFYIKFYQETPPVGWTKRELPEFSNRVFLVTRGEVFFVE